VKHVALLAGGGLHAAHAGVVDVRLRRLMPAEFPEIRSRYWCTPPWRLLSYVLLAAVPAIAELTGAMDGLLWPADLVTRPWRT
jgi:hypothetical protein